MSNEKGKIIVVDSVMGTGKTSWAIQMMNENRDKSFIFCTPFLSEIKRIKEDGCPEMHFYEPKPYNKSKLNDFNNLLMEGHNIAVTHCTFSNANEETIQYLEHGNYCLVLDEVLDVLIDFNDVTGDRLTKEDVKMLFNEGFVEADRYGKVKWVKPSYKNSKYYNVERIAKNGSLFYLDKKLLVWQFPPQIFYMFDTVYVLTYLFEGSFLKPYFEYHGLEYQKACVEQSESGNYVLVEWHDDKSQRDKYKSLINILDDARMNNYKAYTLSKKWYETHKKADYEILQKHLYNYFRNITKAHSKDIMWTCPDAYKTFLKGAGYTRVRNLTKEERGLSNTEKDEIEKKTSCFVPCNARASNMYGERSVLAYFCNMFCNPYQLRYFSNKNDCDGTNIKVNEEYIALGRLLQWIWRSQIRNDKPIWIYIPSTRMRNLLLKWLDGEI